MQSREEHAVTKNENTRSIDDDYTYIYMNTIKMYTNIILNFIR